MEVLLIDGLSSDNTIDIAREFASKYNYIKFISEKDDGIYDAMNKGIKMAKGEWFYFLGSDDKLFNENILSDIFLKINTKQIKIIYGNVLINGDAGWAQDGQIYDGEFSLSKLINEKNICHQAIFYNKTVFEKCGIFNTRYNICADWDMNLRLWATFPFYYIDTVIAVFNGGSTSYRIANNYDDTEKWLNIINDFKTKVFSREFIPFSQNFLTLGRYYYNKKKYFKSLLLLFLFFLQKIRKHLQIKSVA
jgi:glycosyltransferase involved in cell wall biosynthesis